MPKPRNQGLPFLNSCLATGLVVLGTSPYVEQEKLNWHSKVVRIDEMFMKYSRAMKESHCNH